MKLAKRVDHIRLSITQKMNEEIHGLIDSGEFVYNLTAGQLPFHPSTELVQSLEAELKFLNSFQYSPIQGDQELRTKLTNWFTGRRGIEDYSGKCIIANGAKQALYNALGSLVEEGDEVLLIAPYWVSFSEMIKFWGGIPKVIESSSYDNYEPDMKSLAEKITDKTKVLIINSPNNPTGVCYSEEWMKGLANCLRDFPDLYIISDEIYSELSYYDPKPKYFYQFNPELLNRTIIVNGISKSFAATGLRIGYAFGREDIIGAMELIQSQTTSGANSLVQAALKNVSFEKNNTDFLEPVLDQLRTNAAFLREKLRTSKLAHCWYQSTGAFYFLFNFSSTPYFIEKYGEQTEDFSQEICDELFAEKKVALVPGGSFGAPNSGRLSLAFDELLFEEAISHIVDFCHRV